MLVLLSYSLTKGSKLPAVYSVFNIPPQTNGVHWNQKFYWRSWNQGEERPLVKISANWSMVETNLTWRSLRITLSRMKWKSTSICFVQAWKTRFEAMASAETLSNQSIGGSERKIPRSSAQLSWGRGKCTILCFCGGTRDRELFLGRPGNGIGAKKD